MFIIPTENYTARERKGERSERKAREGEGVKAKQDYCATDERPYSPTARV